MSHFSCLRAMPWAREARARSEPHGGRRTWWGGERPRAGAGVCSGAVDRVVFGAAEYVFHADPGPAAVPAAGRGGQGGRGVTGHPDPDGPPSKSTVTATGPDTQFQLPKASIIVLRGKVGR